MCVQRNFPKTLVLYFGSYYFSASRWQQEVVLFKTKLLNKEKNFREADYIAGVMICCWSNLTTAAILHKGTEWKLQYSEPRFKGTSSEYVIII